MSKNQVDQNSSVSVKNLKYLNFHAQNGQKCLLQFLFVTISVKIQIFGMTIQMFQIIYDLKFMDIHRILAQKFKKVDFRAFVKIKFLDKKSTYRLMCISKGIENNLVSCIFCRYFGGPYPSHLTKC